MKPLLNKLVKELRKYVPYIVVYLGGEAQSVRHFSLNQRNGRWKIEIHV